MIDGREEIWEEEGRHSSVGGALVCERKRAGDAAVAGRVAGGEVRDLRMEKGEESGG